MTISINSNNSNTVNSSYSTRTTNLQVMEYDNYKQYLLSNLWKVIRAKVFKRDKYQCQICLRRVKVLEIQKTIRVATQVHHLGYSLGALTGTKPYLLISLCRKCHEECEYDGKVKKAAWEALNKTIYLLTGATKKRVLKNQDNQTVGEFYRDREKWDDGLGTKEAIRKELQRKYPAILTKYAKWWNEVIGLGLAKSLLTTDDELHDFRKLLRFKYRGKVEVMKTNYAKDDPIYGRRLQVVIGNNTRWVWNEDQVRELLK